jgi:WhiB family redox-sensing transcriptional regulator
VTGNGSELTNALMATWDGGPRPGDRDPVRRRQGGVNGAPMAKPDCVDIDIDKAASAWRLDALCAQVEADIFYSEDAAERNEAKRICGLCPVLVECREYALATREPEGVWGGMTPRARAQHRREQRRRTA